MFDLANIRSAGASSRAQTLIWERLMTANIVRVISCVSSLLFLGTGASFASRWTPVGTTGNPSSAQFCPISSSSAKERSARTSTEFRVAGCYCCGWENWNGHQVCVHQCCK
jgi:hypothetical protein